MASLELGDFWLGNVVLFKQDILVCHVFMAADFCFVIAALQNPQMKGKKKKKKVPWIPDRELGGGEGVVTQFNAQTWCFLIC